MKFNTPEEMLILISTPIYVSLILFEIFLSNYHNLNLYTFKDTFYNFIFMILNGIIDVVFRFVYLLVLYFFYDFRIADLDNNLWYYWLFLFVLEDFVFYVLHYFDHNVRLFWAVHITHHSSRLFNLSTGFRSSVFQPLYRFVYFIPLVIIGFNPSDIVVMYAITQIYGILVHTKFDIKFGYLEYIFVTPSHHRVHHASNIKYLDKNMGMCLIIWDRIFGTYQEELAHLKPTYGITKDYSTDKLSVYIFDEWKQIFIDLKDESNLLNKLKILLFPPGWSSTGQSKTTKELQKELID